MSSSIPSPDAAAKAFPALETVTRAMVWNQTLWTAGYSLTTGGFFNYFAKELGADDRMMALLLVIPETVGILALTTRSLVRRLGPRKSVWIQFSLFARFVSLGIPLVGYWNGGMPGAGLWVLAGCLAASQAAGAIAYLCLLSWLADLVPRDHWGRFFARQQIVDLAVLLIVPVSGGYLVDAFRRNTSPAEALPVYVLFFIAGILLLLLSMIPLLRLPSLFGEERSAGSDAAERTVLAASFRDKNLRFLLIHNWWLAASNGLTQAAFFGYLFGPLAIPLATYQLLANAQKLVGIPVSWGTGQIIDRFGNKRLMIAGVFLAGGGAIPFWLLATPEHWWWVVGAYVLWGFWPTVNITGRNLVLKLSPPTDNTTQLALFRQVGGLLAGLSGLAGGYWLASLKASGFAHDAFGWRIEGYQLLFLVSLAGRVTSAFWLLPVKEPDLPASLGTSNGD